MKKLSLYLSRLGIILIFLTQVSNANTFIGQWQIYQEAGKSIAQTVDGLDKLRLEVDKEKQVVIVLTLHDFGSFGTTDNVLEYASPIYGRIRTGNIHIENNNIIIKDAYEIYRFIRNLRDISSHLIFAANNMGYSFTERKVSIAYVNNQTPPTLKRSTFSTVEIDEILESIGIVYTE